MLETKPTVEPEPLDLTKLVCGDMFTYAEAVLLVTDARPSPGAHLYCVVVHAAAGWTLGELYSVRDFMDGEAGRLPDDTQVVI